jgi:uncharacterized protein
MIEFLWLIPVGFIAGMFGTLVGAGGGFILMPILLVLHKDWQPEVLTAVSLAMICGNAVSGSAAYARMKRINYRAGLWFSAAAIPGSIIGAYVVDYIPRKEFNAFFGIAMLILSSYLILSRGKLKEMHAHTHHKFNLWTGVISSFFVGILSSLLGIGGGIIHVPVMIYLLDFPVHLATATSHFVLAIMTFSVTIFHILTGRLDGKYFMVLGLIIGVIVGAQVGAWASTKISGRWIVRGLAIALLMAAVRILWMAFK